jgi:F-type H+-transporting ATPase subunit b
MSLARFVFCMAIACAFCAPAVAIAWQVNVVEKGDVAEKIEHAGEELAHAVETDPSLASTATDPLSVDPDLAIWTLVVFVVLLLVLKKFAWGPILAGLESRESSIANHIAQAERNHEEAKKLLAQYEQKLASAANDVRELMEEARRDADHARQTILAEAKAGAEGERLRALRDIETAADQAMESLAERSAQLAVDLAGKILQSKLSAADHTRLIQEAVAKFPTSSASSN